MTNIDVVLKEIKDLRRIVLTKDDLKNFAAKDDLKNFSTKDDLKNFATKDDLKNFATKDDLKNFPTKDDLKNELKRFSTKDDLKREILGVINYMDNFFVRDHRLDQVKKTVANHEARLLVLEQK